MSNSGYLLGMTLVTAAVTILLRATPFLLFGNKKETPRLIRYLGNMLAAASIAMLVVYCLASHFAEPGVGGFQIAVAEVAGCVVTVMLQLWKRNPLISILGGTAVYMCLIQF